LKIFSPEAESVLLVSIIVPRAASKKKLTVPEFPDRFSIKRYHKDWQPRNAILTQRLLFEARPSN
jgi:hypothetical protein